MSQVRLNIHIHPRRGDRTPQALWNRNSARAVTDGVRRISDLPDAEAGAELRACCASARWVLRMLSQRPFKDADEVFESAERIWWDLGREDWLEAFAAHREEAGVDAAGDDALGFARSRMANDPEAELRIAAAEQAKITRLRLHRLLEIGS